MNPTAWAVLAIVAAVLLIAGYVTWLITRYGEWQIAKLDRLDKSV